MPSWLGWSGTGACAPQYGWTPRHVALWDGTRWSPRCLPTCKTNSHGEFVFDHAWAHAFARHGLDYFPKWLCAVPYTPVTGPRLLARDEPTRRALLDALAAMAGEAACSSAHVNFHAEARRRRIRRVVAGTRRRAVPLAQRCRLGGFRRLPRGDGPQAPQEHPPGTRQGAARGCRLPHRARRRGQRRRPGRHARLLPADVRATMATRRR